MTTTAATIPIKQQLIRHQMAFRAAIVCFSIVLILLIGLLPLFRSAGVTLRKIETRQKEETALSQKVAILSQIDQAVLRERANVIKNALPEKKDVIAYLGAIDGLSKELGLSFGGITITPGDVTTKTESKSEASKSSKKKRTVGQLNVLDTDIKISGTRDGIYAFLRQVEQTLPLMQVSDVAVSKIAEEQYSLSLSLGMLWSPTLTTDLKGAITLFNEKEEAYFQKLNNFRTYAASSTTDETTAILGKENLFTKD